MTMTRKLGRSEIQVSALGMGAWAIGGPFRWAAAEGGRHVGWGSVDDAESIRAIHTALDLGATLFDTADIYGCGHSERVLGQALAGRRHQAVIATKFGHVPDEHTKQNIGTNASAEYICRAVEASLRRLQTDYIDLYQFHINAYQAEFSVHVADVLERLVAAGKIRAYGWSTDFPSSADLFASEGPNCAAIQVEMNLIQRNDAMLAVCDRHNLAALNRGPLCMGVLTGKMSPESTFAPDDIRQADPAFRAALKGRLEKLQAVREVLTQGGRTLAQGALGWLWAKSPRNIPIPGFRTVAQVKENMGAIQFGPLSEAQMRQIDSLMTPERT